LSSIEVHASSAKIIRRWPDVLRKVVIFFLSFCILSFLWYGCVPRPTIKEDTVREEVPASDAIIRQYRSAFNEYKDGDLESAARHFQDFIIQHPRTSLTDDALYFLGDIYFQREEYSVAALQFERLLRYFPSSPHHQEAQWSLANSYYKMGRYRDALKTARQLLPAVEDRPLWRGQLLVFFGDCHAAMNDPLAALSWYVRARRELPPAMREEVRAQILSLLDQDLPPDKYREIAIVYRDTFIALYARYRLAQWYFSEGKAEEAEDLLRDTMQEAEEEDFYPLLEDLWSEIQIGARKEIVLGCILPLQGKAASFGKRALQGLQLAIGAFQPQRGFRVRLIIWDSQGDPARAREGVRVLSKKRHVIAIIGPLLSHTTAAAVQEAEEQRVPLITLSPLQGIAHKGEYIFQNSLTHASQAKTLVNYAFNELGLRTYAILYPRDAYGLTFRKFFQQEVERWGGEVVATASYADDQTDFGDLIKEMVKYEPPQEPQEKPKPIINFEAIFVPDDFKKINLIIPQLAYYDIIEVQLLGTNGWDSPEVIRDSGKFVEGAVFVDGFFKDSPLPVVRSFVMDFEDTFRFSPTLLDALSFDTATFILRTISSRGTFSREALLSFRGYAGVTGFRGFTADGEGIRNLFLLTVSEGKIRQILQGE
jgi:branched-chain amino acid transport system substrate-binding protein